MATVGEIEEQRVSAVRAPPPPAPAPLLRRVSGRRRDKPLSPLTGMHAGHKKSRHAQSPRLRLSAPVCVSLKYISVKHTERRAARMCDANKSTWSLKPKWKGALCCCLTVWRNSSSHNKNAFRIRHSVSLFSLGRGNTLQN